MDKKKVLNDHIMMVSRNGAKKAVPIRQIAEWIQGGSFSLEVPRGNEVGYDFEDHGRGVTDFNAFVDFQRKLRAKKAARSGMPQRAPGGIAEAQFDMHAGVADDNAFTSVPPTKPGTEELSVEKENDPGPPVDPEDMIESGI